MASLLAGVQARAGCTDLIPDSRAGEGPKREIAAEDPIRLRDIGFPDAAVTGSSPLAVSPDGTQVAFVLSRADLESNAYCRGLVVMPTRGGTRPRLIDSGGEFIPLGAFVRGLWVETGSAKIVTPVWSPDGAAIAMLKRENGITQAVVVPLDGRGRRAATRSTVDVEDLWWAADGSKLYFTSRPGVAATKAAIDREGQSGWHYDERAAPNYGPRPRIRASDAPLETFELDIRDGSVRAGSPGQARPGASSGLAAVSRVGRRAWLDRTDPSPFAPQQLWVTDSQGQHVACQAEVCRGRFSGLWWSPDGREVRFLRREGWHHETYAFYRWGVGNPAPVRTLATKDVIQSCVPAREHLICTLENSATPRRVILLDPATGRHWTLFDANPEFDRIRLGTVRRLRWRNDRGLEAWGDMVLPPTYRTGEKLPLIIVQYNSRGFLRGGTGNEYPIFLLAARGFAVLSFERPPAVASLEPNLRTEVELNAANEKGWAERRSVLSALLVGLDEAVRTGLIDAARVGISGLSDGATSARFALINSDRFAAAAIGSCCLEPKTVMTYGGIAWAEFNRSIGYPPATEENPGFWRPTSLAVNAAEMKTPLLMQLADDEYLLALEAFQALREKAAPVELYVYPDEHHVKWQPVHRLAAYNRNLDWFDFWLRCRSDPAPDKAAQYRRWEAMRARAPSAARLCSRSSSFTSSGAPRPRHPPAA